MQSPLTDQPLEHDLAANLRCMRRRMELSQYELAQKVGLNRGNIASYEKGTAEPKLCNLLRLSNYFGVSIHDLTRRDLSCDQNFQQAYASYLRLNSQEANVLDDFAKATIELKEVFHGIVRCHAYIAQKSSSLDNDARMIDSQFIQLRQVSEELFRKHQELIDFIKARLRA